MKFLTNRAKSAILSSIFVTSMFGYANSFNKDISQSQPTPNSAYVQKIDDNHARLHYNSEGSDFLLSKEKVSNGFHYEISDMNLSQKNYGFTIPQDIDFNDASCGDSELCMAVAAAVGGAGTVAGAAVTTAGAAGAIGAVGAAGAVVGTATASGAAAGLGLSGFGVGVGLVAGAIAAAPVTALIVGGASLVGAG